jgi:hypothetical protein
LSGSESEVLADLFSEDTVGEVKIVGGVLGLAVDAGFEMKMRGAGTARLANEGYYLTSLDVLTFLYQVLRVVGIVSFQAVGMFDTHQIAIARRLIGEDDLASESGIDLIPILSLEVSTRMHPSTTLTIRTDDLGTWQGKVPGARVGIDAMGAANKQYP